jgi:hypothetical protein
MRVSFLALTKAPFSSLGANSCLTSDLSTRVPGILSLFHARDLPSWEYNSHAHTYSSDNVYICAREGQRAGAVCVRVCVCVCNGGGGLDGEEVEEEEEEEEEEETKHRVLEH